MHISVLMLLCSIWWPLAVQAFTPDAADSSCMSSADDEPSDEISLLQTQGPLVRSKGSSFVMNDASLDSSASLETLMYKYGTDKSKDDHKYSDLYSMLFDPIRLNVKNVTEIGIATGQSVKVWHDYFPTADIHGLDLFLEQLQEDVKRDLQLSDRIHLYQANSTDAGSVSQLGLVPNSMDIVIDDGNHAAVAQERTLQLLWPFVRPGGYYAIEDVYPLDQYGDPKSYYPFLHNPEKLQPQTQKLFQENDAFFVDTTLGHRAWNQWQKAVGPEYAKDRFHHNSHVVVIRKRTEPLSPVSINYGSVAMK